MQQSEQRQRAILRHVVSKVVINSEGTIVRLELQPPFTYLRDLAEDEATGKTRAKKGRAKQRHDNSDASALKAKSSGSTAACSLQVSSGTLDKTQSEHLPQHKTAHFLQQLIFPQSANLLRLSNKR